MHQPTSDLPEELLERLSEATHVAALTGAGISAASGVPTFRGKDGLWRNHSAEQLATPHAFAKDPALVWEWYGWRRDLVAQAEPNAAHRALVDLAHRVSRLDIITQNVDGLHEQLPLPGGGEIVRLHGSLWTMRCTTCGDEREDRSPGPSPGTLPHCSCGGLMRPGVVWFGEQLAMEDIQRAEEITLSAQVFLVVGTSAVVSPASGFIRAASHAGSHVAEFNLERTAFSHAVDASIQGPCEDSLPSLVECFDRHREG